MAGQGLGRRRWRWQGGCLACTPAWAPAQHTSSSSESGMYVRGGGVREEEAGRGVVCALFCGERQRVVPSRTGLALLTVFPTSSSLLGSLSRLLLLLLLLLMLQMLLL